MNTYKKFEEFKSVCEIAIYFSERMDIEEIKEVLNDLFELYKGMTYTNPIDFLQFHLEDVDRNSHDFWLDKRGLMILHLQTRTI